MWAALVMPDQARDVTCQHIVKVDLGDGRVFEMDKLAECEEALSVVEGLYARLSAENERLRTLLDELDRYVSVPDDTGYVGSPMEARVREALDGATPDRSEQ